MPQVLPENKNENKSKLKNCSPPQGDVWMKGKGSSVVGLLCKNEILDEANSKNKGSGSEVAAGTLARLKSLASALLGFSGPLHSNPYCICWLMQLPKEDTAYPAYLIIYNLHPRLELNILPYYSSTPRDYKGLFFFVGRFIDWVNGSVVYSFSKCLWSASYLPSVLVSTWHGAVSQETAALMELLF